VTLTILIIALTNNPTNARVFERADGLLAVSALLRESETTKVVKQAVLEFLYFYLLPEESEQQLLHVTDTMKKVRVSGSDKSSAGSRVSSSGDTSVTELDERCAIRTVREKRTMLGKYLSSVSGLSTEFQAMSIFEGAVD
jgi:cell division control protein 14 (SIN component)